MILTNTKADLPWLPNPAYADNGDYPHMLVGDVLLVAVPCRRLLPSYKKAKASASKAEFYDIEVIVVTETGFDDAYGESWGSWDFTDVEYYIHLA